MKSNQKHPDPKEARQEQQQRDESERRLRTVVDATPIPLFITRASDGHILYANAKTETLTGLPAPAFIGRKSKEFYAEPDQREVLLATLEKEGLINDYRLDLRKISGERITALLSVRPVVYKSDLAFFVSAVNITERLHSEEALRESEERFRSAFEAAPHGIALIDLEGKWLKVNRALCEIIGHNKVTLQTLAFQDITHPDDLKENAAILRRMLAGEIVTHQVERRFLHKDGHVVWVLLAVSMVWDSKNAPLYFVTQIYDLTERKRAEEGFLESNRRLQGIFDYSPLMISIKGVDGHYKLINKTYADFLEIKSEDIAGKTISERYAGSPDAVRQTETEDRELIRTGEPQQDRITRRIQNGKEHYFLTTKFLLRGADGQPNEICGIAMDITERRQTEDARLESSRRLEGILRYAPFCVSLKDLEGRYKWVNRRYEETFSVRPEDIIGKTTDETYPNDPALDELIKHSNDGDRQAPHSLEPIYGQIFKQSLPDGGLRDFQRTKFVLRDEAGQPTEICSITADVTDRQAMEEAFRSSEEQIRLILETAGEGIYGLDLDGKGSFINPAAAQMVGYSVEDLIGQELHSRIHHHFPDGSAYPVEKCPIHLTLAIGTTHHVKDEVLWRKDGTSFPVEYTSAPIHKNGELVGAVVTFRDITDRKTIEAQLRESEERFRNIAERAPVAISINRISDGVFLYANPRTNAFHGFGPGEVTGKQSLHLYQHPEDRVAIMKELLRMGHLHDREVKLKGLDGTPLTAIISYTRIQFDGEDAAMTATLDVTELKRIEGALRESEQRFRAVVEGSPLPLTIARTSDGRILFANSYVGPAFGLPTEEVIGRHVQDFYQNPEERHAIMAHIHKEGDLLGRELKMKKADGTPMIVLLSTHLVTFQGEETVLTGFQDITDFKEAEDTFRQAMKMEAIGQLTGGIAHDFNNLLGVIIGNLELLEERTEDATTHNFARRALGAADRGATLTRRLLAFSRKQTLEPQPTDLNKLVSGMAELFEHSLAKTIEIKTDFGDALWPVMIDPNQLENVILNLSLNAQDAMPDGGFLTISTGNITAENITAEATDDTLAHDRYVLLTIRDSGTGISKKNLARVFDPFFTTKDVGKGNGLGLSVVYGFIRQSGGLIHIESSLGEGTTIKVYLPTTEKEADIPEAALPMLKGLEGNGETVLIVEDDVEMRSLAKRMLTGLNYRVLETQDAPSALHLLATTPGIDLLFSDVILPSGINGIELVKVARQRYPDLKVLLTSGYLAEAPGRENRVDHSNLGAELVKKPYRKRVLAEKIREALA